MYKQEEIKPYNGSGDKGVLVEQMFDNIAPTYDTLNHRLSFDIDKLWRKKAVRQIANWKPQSVLDIATGTGDFALLTAKWVGNAKIIGADLSEGMMKIARQKAEECNLADKISFQREDCLDMSFGDNTFDVVTAAFGIRNFGNLDAGLKEMHRVLRPGGHLCILELTRPVSFPMRQLFAVYSHTILPLYGKLISNDNHAYKYLTATIEAFPQGEEMVGIFRKAGFREASFTRLTFGICTMYVATK